MTNRDIYITQFDRDRLSGLIAEAGVERRDLDALSEELNRAHVVSPEQVPASVITMNSKILLKDVDTAEELEYTLVFPSEADLDTGAISVLAPVGTAILGYTERIVVEWPVPSGTRRLRIEKVLYQPEAAGDFDR